MKTVSRILCLGAIVLAAKASNAQATATANASATIISPIQISKSRDLEFGSIAPGSAASTVKVANNSARTLPTGNATLVTTGATPTSATFTVTGDAGRQYDITLPADNTISLSDGATHTMAVNSFTHDATGTVSGTLGNAGAASGTETFHVGATLSVSSSQNPGRYTSTFDVTVNYH